MVGRYRNISQTDMNIKISSPVKGYVYMLVLVMPICIIAGYLQGWYFTPLLLLVGSVAYWVTVRRFNRK